MRQSSLPSGFVFVLVLGAVAALTSSGRSDDAPTAKEEKKPTPPSAESSEDVSIKSGEDTLAGTLYLPKGPGRHPAIIFLYGSGGVDRSADGYFDAIWEDCLKAGYACLAWDKPGVGKSTNPGHRYVQQSYYQRASELRRALDFLKARADIDPKRIGCWGISQAGWILPMVASRTKDVAFVIAVSCPAETTVEQSAYQKRCQALDEGETEEAAHQKAAFVRLAAKFMPNPKPSEALWKHLEGSNPDYAEQHFMLSDGSSFVDPVPFLEKTTCPVLVLYGTKDRMVEPIRNARAYEEALKKAGNEQVTIKTFSGADHLLYTTKTGSLKEIQQSSRQTPRPFIPGFLDTMSQWLKDLDQAQRAKK